MMKQLFHVFMALVIAAPSFVIPTESAQAAQQPAQGHTFNVEKDCPQGKCVDQLIDLAEAKIAAARGDQCLPPEGTKNEKEWFEQNTLTIDCFRQIKEIEEINEKLDKVQAHYSGLMIDDQERMCREEKVNAGLNLQNLNDIARANEAASCTPQRKQQVLSKCGSDAMCVFIASATGIAGPFANKLIPASLKNKGCSATQDNCFMQLGTAFVKAVFGFFGGLWDLAKAGWRKLKEGATNFWNWMTGAEKHSSTAQLAAAKSSEEEGIFRQLINDFPGTMKRIWSGLVAALKEWLSNDVFCQEWSGVPRFSQCKRPAQGIGCTECKAMINGMCAITGTLVAEIIPAFLTGGLVTCAKYGVSAASKVAKLFKVSATTAKVLQRSRIASMVVKPVARITQAIVKSRFSRTAMRAMETTVKAVGRFMLRPSIKAIRRTFTTMRAVARAGKTFIMLTPAGPVIKFTGKALSVGEKVIMFPFENALTIKSFQLGEKTFEKIFQKVGSARFFGGIRPVLAGEAARAMGLIDDAYIEYQVTRHTRLPGSQFVTLAEENYIKTLRLKRGGVIDNYLAKKPEIPLKNLLDDLYPELEYGKYAKHLKPEDLLKAENDLFEAIGRMPKGPAKDRLIADFQKHTTSAARAEALAGSPTFTKRDVIANATLDSDERVSKALEVAGIQADRIPAATLERLKLGVLKAHEEGAGTVFRYTFDEIRSKYRILNEAGFTNRQAELMIRSGLAGKVRPEDMYDVLRAIPMPEMSPAVLDDMVKSKSYGAILSGVDEARRPATARALQILEDAAESTDEAASLYRKYEANFQHVQKLSAADSDAAGMLAEFIAKQKKAGVADDVIRKKLDDAFGACQ